MRFYDYRFAPSPRKVRLFIQRKGSTYPRSKSICAPGRKAEPDFLAKNPSATVPVLELDDGTCLTESLAICHYLERVHPSRTSWATTPRSRRWS